jgi:competence protein ComEC
VGLFTELRAMKHEWYLLAFGIGIAAYYVFSHEPSLVYWGGALCFMCALVFWARNTIIPYEIAILLFFTVLGVTRSSVHTSSVAAPILPATEKYYVVSGWIERSDRSKSFQNFYIRVAGIEGRAPEHTPKIIRVRSKPREFVPGDSIKISAVLSAPPGPAVVGGYDSARAAYYKGIGAYGFAVSKPQKIDLPHLGVFEKLKRQLVRKRYSLSVHIQSRAPPKTAGLQAALLTGDRSGVTDVQQQTLRDAGLAHLLAISGLHMGLLAGGAFYVCALLFSTIGPLARRYDMRKPAALIGSLFALFYLIISGASVSTQRAFIMALCIFAAVIFDRRALSIRSVTLAAAITLLFHPEALLSAGFQMSFAATAALVSVYRWWAEHRRYAFQNGFFKKLRGAFVGISVTSLVAGLATGGFAALHFHRFARLGFFANITAMPVFTFIVMPSGFLALLLMPLGWDGPALKIMGLGLDYVLAVAAWISNQDGAVTSIKAANGIVMSFFGLGFIWLCLGPWRVRMAGSVIMGASVLYWVNIPQPDMRISATARVAFWDPDEVEVLRVDRKRGDGFGRARFIERAGIPDAQLASYVGADELCDAMACRIRLKDTDISIVHTPEGVAEACYDSALVILTLRAAGPRSRRQCKAVLIEAAELERNGARDITLEEDGNIKVRLANPKRRRNRPWG